jgi:hypothetical protein
VNCCIFYHATKQFYQPIGQKNATFMMSHLVAKHKPKDSSKDALLIALSIGKIENIILIDMFAAVGQFNTYLNTFSNV